MRRLILSITAVAFMSGQTAGAFPQSEVPEVKDFIQKTGWNKKPVKLKELYAMSKDTLPLDFRFEMERLLELHPDAELPKIEVRMIKNGKNEDMQLIAQQGKQAATVTLMKRGPVFAEITHSHKGKNLKNQITYDDIYSPVRMINSIYTPSLGLAGEMGFARLLRSNELALMKSDERVAYSEQVRELVSVAEKAQTAMDRNNGRGPASPADKKKSGAKTAPKKTSHFEPSILKLLLGEDAFAMGFGSGNRTKPATQPAISGPCLVMGWTGSYVNGVCTPPAEAKDTTCSNSSSPYRCAKMIYGTNAACGIYNPPEGSGSSTDICSQKNSDNRYDVFLGVKTQEDFDKKSEEISLQMGKIKSLCDAPKNSQVKECQDLAAKYSQLQKVNCDQLKKWKEQFTDLRCKGLNGAAAAADMPPVAATTIIAEGDGVDGEGQGEIVVAAAAPPAQALDNGVADAGQCGGLPVEASRLNCSGRPTGAIFCNTNGENRKHFFCLCNTQSEDIYNDSVKPTGCKVKQESRISDRSDRSRYERKPRERKEKSFWQQNGGMQGFLGGMMGVGLAFITYWSQQQQMKAYYSQYYKMYEPEVLKIAPPPTSVINPTLPGTTYPVNVIPGTR